MTSCSCDPVLLVEGSNRFTDLIQQAFATDYDSKKSATVVTFDDPITLARDHRTRLCTVGFEPGDITVFTMKTLHGTFDNHSPIGRVRLLCDVRWQPEADAMDGRYFGPNPTGTTGSGYGELNGARPLAEP